MTSRERGLAVFRGEIPDHKVDLRKAKECFGNQMAVMGNLDSVSVMLNDDVSKVIETAEKCFEDAGQGEDMYSDRDAPNL